MPEIKYKVAELIQSNDIYKVLPYNIDLCIN